MGQRYHVPDILHAAQLELFNESNVACEVGVVIAPSVAPLNSQEGSGTSTGHVQKESQRGCYGVQS